MRPSLFLLSALLFASPGALASWFGSDETSYESWNTDQLKKWLDDHHITSPQSTTKDQFTHNQLLDLVKANWNTASAWTYDQYNNAQKTFVDMRDTTFDTWDESRLREFLLEQGIVAPSGPREQLVLLAKSRYRAYTDAASSFTSSASRAASTAVYGDAKYQATQSLSSIAAQATKEAQRTLDDSKDYVYSTWDDNRLRSYLEEKGVIKTKSEKKREELLSLMRDNYAKVANPVWEAWSDSYIHEWLINHNILDGRSDLQKKRDEYVELMKQYYYGVNDRVWDSWSDSELRQWLIDNNVIKSDAQLKREKMLKLVEANYLNAKNSVWDAWTDSQMRDWLIENGYMKSDAQAKRDELVKMINDKYTTASDRTAAYLMWPDARLRAFLREKGFPEQKLPRTRSGLLQETRIRYVQSTNRAEAVFASIREVMENKVTAAEEKLANIWHLIRGESYDAKDKAAKEYERAKADAEKEFDQARKTAEKQYEDKKAKAYQKAEKAKEEFSIPHFPLATSKYCKCDALIFARVPLTRRSRRAEHATEGLFRLNMSATASDPPILPANYIFIDEAPSLENYLALRRLNGLSAKSAAQGEAAISGSWAFSTVVYQPETPESEPEVVAMARLIGDGGWYFIVADVAVLPAHRRKGLGEALLRRLLRRIEEGVPEPKGVLVTLFADEMGRALYRKCGFVDSAPESVGMWMKLARSGGE
ncbi:hypothetical protein V5O48_007505 [Marasmius crinis-equi]|uniref:N-acetyltransferase domain-containing protein n=1 Tax=Marasmius crinis-equi TaxID=585013 RepID=A0ABR3FH66_9AGAR